VTLKGSQTFGKIPLVAAEWFRPRQRSSGSCLRHFLSLLALPSLPGLESEVELSFESTTLEWRIRFSVMSNEWKGNLPNAREDIDIDWYLVWENVFVLDQARAKRRKGKARKCGEKTRRPV
jgi:hypothetical protein